jgi:membrane protein
MSLRRWWLAFVAMLVIARMAKGRAEMRPSAKDDDTVASSPVHLQRADWKGALQETKRALKDKQIPLLAAGIAYFSTLAFFPLMAAAVALAGLVLSSEQIQSIVQSLGHYLPQDIASLVSTQLQNVSGEHVANLIVGIVALLVSLFSVSGAVQNSIKATNLTYDLNETRKFIKMRATSLLLTLGLLVVMFIVIPVLLINQSFLLELGVPSFWANILPYGRWVALVIVVSISLAVFYRYGPNRTNPQWQWVSWGATMATIIWLIGTALFFVYAQNFAQFSKSFGLFAGIIVLMTWLNLSAFIVLLGAEVNHRLESKTDADTETK